MKTIRWLMLTLLPFTMFADTCFVNTDNTGTQDGTTVETGYASAAIALDARDNAGSYNGKFVLYISGSTADPTSAYTIDSLNWTNLTDSLIIAGNPTASYGAHPGYWSTSHARFESSSTTWLIKNRMMDKVAFRRLQFRNTGSGAAYRTMQCEYTSTTTFDACIVWAPNSGNAIYVEGIGPAYTATVHIFNSVLYHTKATESSSEAFQTVSASNYVVNLYNSVVTGYDDGVESDGGGNVTIRNTVFINNNDDIDDALGTYDYQYIASDDAFGCTGCRDASPGVVESDGWTHMFENYATGDFRRKATDTILDEKGTNLYSVFTRDIRDTLRPAEGAWDIGITNQTYGGPLQYTVSATASGGWGTVNPASAQDTCGDTIRIAAIPSEFDTLLNWTITGNNVTHGDTTADTLWLFKNDTSGGASVSVVAHFADTTPGVPVDTASPADTVDIVFVHHSTGRYWLSAYSGESNRGALGDSLAGHNYRVHDIDYDNFNPTFNPPENAAIPGTDIGQWYRWFLDTTMQANGVRRFQNLTDSGLYKTGNKGDETYYTPLGGTFDSINEVIVIKSCYPNSNVQANNSTTPTNFNNAAVSYRVGDEYVHTIGNIKDLYRRLLSRWKSRPDKMFVVVTAPPLYNNFEEEAAGSEGDGDWTYPNDDSLTLSANARRLNLWLVDTLLQDSAWERKNVYVYDFYNVLSDTNNHHYYLAGQEKHLKKSASKNWTVYPHSVTPTFDQHPSTAGYTKATSEFIPLLNGFYNDWQAFLEAPVVPQYTRDTAIVGGHASVAIVPATLSPVDSGTACTTSVTVDEGYRCDSIVSVRGGQRYTVTYPATRITYLITANAIDTVFISALPIVPDSSDISVTQPEHGAITLDPVALRRAAGDQTIITFVPDNHYGLLAWTGGLADSSGNPVTYTFPASGTMAFSATAVLDQHTVTLVDGDSVALTAINGTTIDYGAVCSVSVACTSGSAWRINGGPAQYQLRDTLLITAFGDTVITATSFLRTTLSSVYCWILRDSSGRSVVRRSDTVTVHGSALGILSDSTRLRIKHPLGVNFLPFQVLSVWQDSVHAIVHPTAIRGVYNLYYRDGGTLYEDTLESALRVKIPFIGAR